MRTRPFRGWFSQPSCVLHNTRIFLPSMSSGIKYGEDRIQPYEVRPLLRQSLRSRGCQLLSVTKPLWILPTRILSAKIGGPTEEPVSASTNVTAAGVSSFVFPRLQIMNIHSSMEAYLIYKTWTILTFLNSRHITKILISTRFAHSSRPLAICKRFPTPHRVKFSLLLFFMFRNDPRPIKVYRLLVLFGLYGFILIFIQLCLCGLGQVCWLARQLLGNCVSRLRVKRQTRYTSSGWEMHSQRDY